MKKLLIVVVLLVLLAAVAPGLVGKLAEGRVNKGLDKLVAEVPYITIVERKWTGGWFRSEQEVTVEMFGAWKDLFDAAKTASLPADRAEFRRVADTEAEAAMPEGDAMPPADEAQAKPKMPFSFPLRFTVKNEVLHGPILWTSGVGLAQVNSTIVMSEKMRDELRKALGTDEPIKMKSRVGLFGGGTTTLYGDAHSVKSEKANFGWDAFDLKIGYSGDLNSISMSGKQPRIELTDAKGEHFTLRNVTLESKSDRIVGELYDTDFKAGIAEVVAIDENKKEVRIKDVHYDLDTTRKGEFIDVGAKFGSGELINSDLDAVGIKLKAIHYDFSFRRLHVETLDKLAHAMKDIYAKPLPVNSPDEIENAIIKPFKEHVQVLLTHDPELGVDNIGIVTAEGEGFIKGLVKFKGLTIDDFGNPMMILPKLDADFTVELSKKMLEKFPNGAQMVGAAIATGYMKDEGDKLICKVTLQNSELTVNGKPTPIPGLGGGPPSEGAMEPEGAPHPEG